jgi:dihydropteroate synthase
MTSAARPDAPVPAAGPRRVLFVTGRLAEPALRRVLEEMAPPFAYDLAVLRITVAALMTTEWIARFLTVPEGTELVIIPGLCEGDPAVVSAAHGGVPVERGPKDLREIPRHFGRQVAAREYGAYDIEILAEINNAPRLSREGLRAAADYYRASGADVIDVGCTPGRAFPALGDVVRELREAGMRVSVDSFDVGEIRTAVAAGAELVLSVNGSNLEVVDDLAGSAARVVVVPELGGDLSTLEPSLARLEQRGVRYLIDPILEPIGFGFMASLERYAAIRRRYPEAEMLMGIGNLTELTAADTTGVNALLIAVCQELGVRAVLTTEVIAWARGAVREVDVARRLMHHAVTQRTIPKEGRRPAGDGEGSRDPGVHGGRAARAAGRDPRSELPHLRRRGDDHGAQQRALRARHRHPGAVRAARRRRADARVLPGQGAGEGPPRAHARQELPTGGLAVVGLSHPARTT